MNLFAYGTLMVPEILAMAAGRAHTGENARLAGYARYKLKEKHYPALIPASGETTDGIVYFDLDESAVCRLDIFEGEMYDRTRVRVLLADKTAMDACTYVLRGPYRSMLSREEWSLEEFKKKDQPDFIRTYFGFGAISKDGP